VIFDDLRFLKRLSLWLLIPLTALTLVVSGMLYWLCATESGARWLVRTAAGDRFQATSIDGTLKDGLTINGLNFTSGESRIHIAKFKGQWQLMSALGGQLVVDRISATGLNIKLPPSTESDAVVAWPSWHLPLPLELREITLNQLSVSIGEIDYNLEHITLTARINPFKTHIDQLVVKAPDLGQISLRGNLSNRYPYNNQLSVEWTYLQGNQPFSGVLKTRGNLKKLSIEHQLTAPYTVTTNGELSLPSSRLVPAMAELRSGLNYSLSNQWQQALSPLEGRVPSFDNASITVDGKGSDYNISGQARLLSTGSEQDIIQKLHGSRVTLKAQGDASGLKATHLGAAAPWGTATTTGSIGWIDGFNWDGTLILQDMATEALVPNVAAVVSSEIATRGQISEQTKEAEININTLSGLIHGRVIAGAGQINLTWNQGLNIGIKNTHLRAGSNSARLQGSIAISDTSAMPTLSDLSWQIDAPDLAELGPEFGGAAESRGTVTGPWPQLKISGSTQGRNLHFAAWRSRELNLSFSGDSSATDQADYGQKNRGELLMSGIQAPGFGPVDLKIKAMGNIAQHRLNIELQQGLSAISAELTGGMNKGGTDKKTWQGDIASLHIDVPYTEPWQLAEITPLQIGPKHLAIAPFCLGSSTGNACGQIDYRQDRLNSRLTLDQINLAFLRQWLPPTTSLEGMISGILALEGPLDSLSGHYQLESNAAEISVALTEEKTLTQTFSLISNGQWQKGGVNSTSELVLPRAGEISVNANIALASRNLSGTVRGKLDSLDWLQALTEQVQGISGQIEADIDLTGTLASPEARGRLVLADLKATVPATGTDIDDGELTLSFDNRRWDLAATATSMGQSLSIEGSGQSGTEQATLVVTGDNFPLINVEEYKARISPDLSIEYQDRTATLRGKLVIPEADIHIKPRPTGITEVSSDEVITPATEQAASMIRVKTDINLIVGDRVNFEGYGLTTSLQGELRIRRQSQGIPSARGTITLTKGTYEAYGQELDISHGLLLFQGPLDNPGLNIRAQRQTREALVGVNIGGTAAKIESTLFSEPALPQTHALSLLVSGKLPGNFSQAEGNQMANTAAALGISQSEWLTTQLQQGLGVDVLSLQGGETYLDSSVIVGKYLSPRLYVSYVQKLFSPQGSLAFEYSIDERLGLKAESGDAQSLDIQYRIEH